MPIDIRAIGEGEPGPVWAHSVKALWPAYKRWYLSEGERARPTYLACRRALLAHMPELVPLWARLTELGGGSDLLARCLSGWGPPPYLKGCSQAVWIRDGTSRLIRNYDYRRDLWEGRVWRTGWLGSPVLGVSDCMWGLLDGVNEAGVAVSLAFGGHHDVGEGFGIPMVLRYILQTCRSTREAVAVLERMPCHMAYTVTVLDRDRAYATVYLGPGRPAIVSNTPVATNHQGRIEWTEHALATESGPRLLRLASAHQDPQETFGRFADRFLEPPVWSDPAGKGWGTLYTSIYDPALARLELRWRGTQWATSIDRFTVGPIGRGPTG